MKALLAALAWLAAVPVAAVESDPLPVPVGSARAAAVVAYNEGVALLLARRYADAQEKFQAAIALDEQLAEAHNNLAFSLRMQGRHNFERALRHYDRAIALKPGLAQAYMYRGMLFTQQGDRQRALADLQRLRQLDAGLARDLQQALEGRPAPERSGVAGQYE